LNIVEAIKTRRSIRGYKPDPVPKEILLEVMEIARRAPSSMNTQPWEIVFATGKVLDNIKRDNMEKLAAGEQWGRGGPARPYEGIYRERQVEVGIELYKLLGISRDDMERRAEWWQQGFRYFDAPVAVFLCADTSFPEMNGQLGLGIIAQTLCLAAYSFGLGTCIESQGVAFPDVIRKHAGLPEAKRIATSIALGYPDWSFPGNDLISSRAPMEEIVTWCGFD
jgi:nitroreductase